MNVRIRDATPGDAAALTEVYRDVLFDGRGTVVAPEDAPDVEAMAARIRHHTGVMLALEVDGAVRGEGALTPFEPRYVRHVGTLSMHVHPSVQGRGLGRRLIRALLARAPGLGLERVELYVRSDNPRAIRLYRSEGFVREGVRRAFVRPPAGPAVDDYVMARFFHPPRAEEVLALVVRRDRGRPELLVLASPSGEVRVPRGALAAGDPPIERALRVLAEDAGVTAVRLVAALPPRDEPRPEREDDGLPVLHRVHAVVLEPTGTALDPGPAARWLAPSSAALDAGLAEILDLAP